MYQLYELDLTSQTNCGPDLFPFLLSLLSQIIQCSVSKNIIVI